MLGPGIAIVIIDPSMGIIISIGIAIEARSGISGMKPFEGTRPA